MDPIRNRTLRKVNSVLVSALALALACPLLADAAIGQTATGAQSGATVGKGDTRARYERDYRASDILGKEVKSKENVDFGKIADLVVNMTSGDVSYAILSLRGEVGIGETRFYAIPTKSLTMGARRGDLMLTIAGSTWREKGFPSSTWSDLRNPGYWNEVDRLSGAPAVQPAEAYFAYRASELVGKSVQDVEGKKLGVLRDLVIDMNGGKVRYAALDFEPGKARPDKLLAIPVSSFIFREDRNGKFETARPLVLDMEPSALASMRGFNRNRWPDVNEPSYAMQTKHHPQSVSALSAPNTVANR